MKIFPASNPSLSRVAGTFLILGSLSVFSPWTLSSVQESPVESTRAALEQMVEARRILSQEKRDWQLGKEILQDRLGLVRDEIAHLRERIAGAQSEIVTADEKRLELIEQNEALQQATGGLYEVVTDLENGVQALLLRLPDPLRETVRPFSQGFPQDPTTTELSLSRRFQNVIAVLEGVDKFHREIRIASEVRELPNGATAEVTALYVGIGHGYYVTAKGDAAGVGTGTENGWTWKANDAAAPAIAEAISILESKSIASFVSLPVEIQ